MSINTCNTPISVWLAEGQSSQRDMLLSLQALKAQQMPLHIIASHRHDRPEILGCADMAYREPHFLPQGLSVEALPQARVDFVRQHAIEQGVQVLLTGRNSSYYEAERATFAKAGIRLLTGATSTQTLALLEDKASFTAHCEAHDIAVASGWRFDNLAELEVLLETHAHLPLCVKPITGIFAQGFWRLDTGNREPWDSFNHLYFTDDKKIQLAAFLHAYAHSHMVADKPIPMLLMPYLSGQEYSIDAVCEQGEVLAAVTRYKEGAMQYIGYDESVMAVVKKVVASVKADGIISIQTKADDHGNHKVLEINARPSGGIAYTDHAFGKANALNLTQLAFAYWAGLIDKPNLEQVRATITPCSVRPLMSSVKVA
jgi:carbamoylphosphate synthase large subunit